MSSGVSTEARIYRFNRRNLLRAVASGAMLAQVLDLEELRAQGMCERIDQLTDLSKSQAPKPYEAASIPFYWIDGFVNLAPTEASTLNRARIAATLELKQSSTNYVEAILLVLNKKVVAAHRYGPGDIPRTKNAPYAIFENIALQLGAAYEIHFYVRKNDELLVINQPIAPQNLRASRLDYSHLSVAARARLPKLWRKDFESAFPVNGKGFGHLSNANGRFTFGVQRDCMALVSSVNVSGNRSTFAINIYPFKDDPADAANKVPLNATNFLRNFAVLDPVGRPIGWVRRHADFSTSQLTRKLVTKDIAAVGTTPAGKAADFVTVTGTLAYEPVGRQTDATAHPTIPATPNVMPLDNTWQKIFEHDKALIEALSIEECPYVHVVIDDGTEIAAKLTIRMR